jgi:hypothetical protein
MAQLQEQRQQRAALMAQRSVQRARLQTEQGVDDELMGRACLVPKLLQRFIN